jgi:nucleotide-binding universal stress UspA family protein
LREIVVGVDGSDASRAALLWALEQGARSGSRVTGVTVWPVGVELEVLLDAASAEALSDSLGCGSLSAVPQIASATLTGSPGAVLVDRARDADLLVVGSHRQLAHRPGTTVDSFCLHHSRTPVAVVPGPRTAPPGVPGPVAVGVDLTPHSAAALRWAAHQAHAQDAELVVAYAWQVSPRPPGLVHPATTRRTRESSAVHELREWTDEVLGDQPRPQMRLYAEHGGPLDVLREHAVGAGMLCLGSQGHHTLARILGGSVSGQLALLCSCPVVVVPPSASLTVA